MIALPVGSPPWWLALTFAGGVALAALRAGSLRADGALAAAVIGALALRVSWAWGIFLIGWFILASVLSRIGRERKAGRTQDVVAKSDRRDAVQVLANGGVFACCAWWTLMIDAKPQFTAMLSVAGASALAAAGADTWSTEIGTLWGGEPWSLRAMRRVPIGTSGAITMGGTLGGVLGAIVLAALAAAVGMISTSSVVAVAIGGIAGATFDTMLGAWGQERRWCSRCARDTERTVHSCGTHTDYLGGVRRLDNDVVNALCTLVGALVGCGMAEIGPILLAYSGTSPS
jgi:uncharacterized protein (TIGR00297 family)